MSEKLIHLLLKIDGLGVDRQIRRTLRELSAEDVSKLISLALTAYLDNRQETLKDIFSALRTKRDELLVSPEILALASAEMPSDEIRKLFTEFGIQDKTSVLKSLKELQASTNVVESERWTSILQEISSRPRAKFSTLEAECLVSPEFQDSEGILNVFKDYYLAENYIPWNADLEEGPSAGSSIVLAAAERNPEFLNAILRRNQTVAKAFNLEATDRLKRNLMQIAVQSGCVPLARRVLDIMMTTYKNKKSWIDHQSSRGDGTTVLFDAALSPNYDQLLRPFLDLGADQYKLDRRGRSLLTHLYSLSTRTSQSAEERIIDLVGAGIDVDQPDRWGRTLAMVAASKKDLNMLQVLSRCGANFKRTDKAGLTVRDHLQLTGDENALASFELEFGTPAERRTPIFRRKR